MVTDPSGATLGFGGVRWDVIVTGRSESFDVDPTEPGVPHTPQFQQLPTLIQGLLSRGYDIVYVDFADAGTYIQANAEFLIGVIERVNNAKITDEKTVLIGASMGGIVSRLALAKMEQEGKSHCVGLFGTLDTPHNGANIPLSLQAFSWHMHATDENHLAWNAMDTPAARQQILKHLGTAVQDGDVTPENDLLIGATPLDFSELHNADYSILRNQLQNDLLGVGWPAQPRKIAMLNGMKDGTLPSGHGYGPGDKFCEANLYVDDFDLGTVFKIIMRSNNGGGTDFYSNSGMVDCSQYQGNGWSNDHLFTIVKPHDFNPCNIGPWGSDEVPYKYHVWRLKATGNLPFLDNAPGGFRMDMRAIHHSVESTLKSGTTYHKTINFPISTFVPTWSGLAMGTALTNTNLFVDLTAGEFDPLFLPNDKVPNFDNFYAPTTNLRHVELDGGMVTFIFEELDRLDAAPRSGTLVETYNYGDGYKEIPNTTVSPTGVLHINNPGPTGFVQSAPQGDATKPLFTTYLNNCGQIITVEAGGQYNIGALDKSQHGVTEVWRGATVHIKQGGILRITSEQSQLLIRNGATLILDPGAIVRLESPGANIRIEGDLIVNGDINFQGLGFFDFGTGNRLVFGPGYKNFKLIGAGKDKRFVRLSADVLVDNANRLDWRTGLLQVGHGTIHLVEGAGLDFSFMTITGQGSGGVTAVSASESGAIRLTGCDVEHLGIAIEGVNGHGCNIESCQFKQVDGIGVIWNSTLAVVCRNSSFEGSSGASAFWMENVGFLLLQGSFISGYTSPIQGIITDADLMDATPAVYVDKMIACLVKNTHFASNTLGIKAANLIDGTTANVYAFDGSSFDNHDAAIFVYGDETEGAVLADCVLFQDNLSGIRGRDITLMIDSWNSSVNFFDTDSPNRFLRDNVPQGGMTTDHVRICYDQKAVGGSRLMRNNFWGISTGGVPITDPNPLAFLFLQDANCANNIAAPVLSPFGSKFPICTSDGVPPNFALPLPGSECPMPVAGQEQNTSNPIAVHEQFHLGTFLMKIDSVQEAIDAMRPVAALWQSDMSGLSDNCQQYIQVAKAFVDASDASSPGLPRPGADRANAAPDQLNIAPNPADNTALISLGTHDVRVSVWDFHGKIIHQGTVTTNTYRLDTKTWHSGIYVVEVVSADGRARRGKLIVQH